MEGDSFFQRNGRNAIGNITLKSYILVDTEKQFNHNYSISETDVIPTYEYQLKKNKFKKQLNPHEIWRLFIIILQLNQKKEP